MHYVQYTLILTLILRTTCVSLHIVYLYLMLDIIWALVWKWSVFTLKHKTDN